MPAKKNPSATATVKRASPTLDLIRDLAAILQETGMSEVELDQKGVRVRLARVAPALVGVAPQVMASSIAPQSPVAAASLGLAKAAEPETAQTVKSPMVGTVFMAATPGGPNFVELGSEVKQGQTLLIIEAMKTMNQIPSPVSGKLVRIFVGNGDPVEFGEALVAIE